MFETVTQRTVPGVFAKLIAFCIHQVLAAPGALLGTMITFVPLATLVDAVLRGPGTPSRAVETIANVFTAAWGGLLAWLLGRAAGRLAPVWARFGRFAWVLPATLMFLLVVSDVRRLGTTYASDLRGYLGFASAGTANLGFVLVTLPVMLSLGYVWGLRCGVRHAKRLPGQHELASEEGVDAPTPTGH